MIGRWACVTLSPRERFLDVGANLGYLTLMFAQAGWDTVSVEAMSRNRATLETSLCLNPHLWPRVQIVAAALMASSVAAATTTCLVTANLRNFGDGKVKCLQGRHDCPLVPRQSHQCETVRPMTLDQVLKQSAHSHIDVAKVDVEGLECSVLSGGELLFQRPWRVALLQVETNF